MRVVDGKVLNAGAGGRRAHLLAHWPMVEKKDVQGGNTELNFVYTVKSDKTQAIPLEKLLTAPFEMGNAVRVGRPVRAAAEKGAGDMGAVRVQAAPVVVVVVVVVEAAAAAAAARVADNG